MNKQENLRIVVTAVNAGVATLRTRILRIAPRIAEVAVCESPDMLREVTRFNDYDAVLIDTAAGGCAVESARGEGAPAPVESARGEGAPAPLESARGEGAPAPLERARGERAPAPLEIVGAAVRSCPLVPVIVVSNEPESAVSEQMLRLGAQDYLVKRETNGAALVRAIQHAVERKRLDIRLKTTLGELGQANARLRSLALKDTLTGALNRRAFQVIGSQMLARARRHDRQLALLYCDLDGFKQINDTLGHAVGDVVLKTFRERCAATLRRGDNLARLGGDEFVVLLEEISDPAYATEAARRIRAAFDAPIRSGSDEVKLRLSIGIAYFPECDTIESLIAYADRAMYVAKRGAGIASVATGKVERAL